ncbi:hypothetical protein GCM10023185_25850 [Hymenobacter saemangeumensis]|uniref:Fibronectin type-III domain-containing protein n=1 Tax=Hymenobacter saemangeumensis TaxID=1084522 RepID=A0ABP8IID8_9BACT
MRSLGKAGLRAAAGTGLGLLLHSPGAQAQQRASLTYFQDDAPAQVAARISPLAAQLQHSRPLTLDAPGMLALLATAPPEGRAGAAPVELTLPLPDGGSARFRIVESSVMEPALAARFPTIKTYAGIGLDEPGATVRLDMTPRGFHAQILSPTAGTVYIDPASPTDLQHYLSFWRRDMPAGPFSCGVSTPSVSTSARNSLGTGSTAQRTAGTSLRTYRLAVAATGEYTATKGGTVTGAQAGIVTTVNRVVGVYEKELAVRLVLVTNNSSLIYTNGNTDPYTNNDGVAMLSENQTNVTNIIGSANYDIGHVFSTGGGGVAGLGVVCNSTQKARGVTGSSNPVGDAFDIDYVAHEIGHQFGGNHTFNSTTGSCGGGNRNASTAYEPGSGTTIMAYAGICSGDNIQSNSDPYFHVASFEEIQTFIGTTSCAVTAATNNTAPAVTLPASGEVLPINTPFKLTAAGSDSDGDALTYCWEEYDLGPGGSPTATQVANQTPPLFRSFNPSTSPTRYFPRLSNLVANTTNIGERLPTVTRNMTFRVTVRDQHNGSQGVVGGLNSSANVTMSTTSAAGPFLVTAPNTAITWTGGSSQTVTWDVAGTTASPVSCATVNIRLSTDGGFTYPTVLLAGTANDGTQAVTVPSINTTQARIMVEAADNYFFDISNANFTISSASVCAAPNGLNASNVTQTSATINFTASGSATSYTVTTSPATTTQTVTASPVSLTGLLSNTSYTVSIVSNCAAGATSTAASLTFTTGAAPPCNEASSLAVGSITSTSASVSFTASGTATSYTVTTTPATTTQTVTASPVSLTGLSAGTSYTVNIVSNCAAGATSTPATVSFATSITNDECATAVTLTSATTCITTSGTVTGATQSQAPSTCSGFASPSALDVWYSFTATGPNHTITASSSFDAVLQLFSGACGSLTSLQCVDATTTGAETLSLTNLTAGTVYKVRYYPYGSSAPTNGSFTICVSGPVAPVSCPAPTGLASSNVTSSSASVSFTLSGAASSYTVTTSPATTTQTVTASPVSLTGLTAGTSYTVNIVSNCGANGNSTTASTTFTTGPAPVVSSVFTPASVTYPMGATIPVTVRFSQSMVVTGLPSLSLTIGSTVRQAVYSAAGSSGTDVVFNYVVQAGDLDTNGIDIGTISLNGGTIRNAAATNAVLTLNSVQNTNNVRVDGVVPTVTSINRLTPATALTNAASVTFRITFSENVTGVDAADFALTTTGTVAGTIASVSGTTTTRDIIVNGLSGDGTLRLDLIAAGSGIIDAATNPVGSDFTSGQTYTLDRNAPDTNITSSPAATTTNTSATFTFTGTDGSGSGVASFEGSLDGAAFTTVVSPLTFTGLGLGLHTFQVRAIDAAGNVDATPASYSWTVVAATPAPTVSSFTPASGPVGTSVSISGANFTGATAVTFNGTAVTSFTVNSATSITATVPSGASTGVIAVTTAAGTGSSTSSFTVTLPNLVVSSSQTIPGGSYNNITITGPGSGGAGRLDLGGALTVAGTLMVMDGGMLQTNCNVVSGAGSFTLAAGATLNICSPAGISASGGSGDIQMSGARSFSTDASYNYMGSQAQVTGSGLPATVRSLTAMNAAGVTLSGNVSIRETLTPALGTLTTTGRVLTLLSDASGTAIVVHTRPVAGLISGPITVQRYVDGSVNAGVGYRHFSSPVTNTTVADLSTGGFTPVVNPAYNSSATPTTETPFPTVFGYDESRISTAINNLDSFSKGWFSPSSLTQSMTWGRGYTVNSLAGITPDFVGAPGQTTLTLSGLSRGPQADAGWQLLGNPYPSPINWDSVRLHNGLVNIDNALYVFKSTGPYVGNYSSYVNGIGLNGGGPVLPVAQGFFVRTSTPGASGQVTFRNIDRLTTPTAPAFQRQAAGADARPQLRLRLSGANASPDETVVYLQAGATASGTDRAFDAPKLNNPGAAISLASLMNGPQNAPLAINGLPELSLNGPATRVPLLLVAPVAGAYRFQVAELSGFAASTSITLVDHATNTSTDLRLTPAYAFTAAQAGSIAGRFELVLGRAGSVTGTTAALATQFSVWPNPATKQAALQVALAAPVKAATVTLHTLLGQQLSQRSFSGAATEVPTAGLAAGTYLLTVQVAGHAATTHRVVVE